MKNLIKKWLGINKILEENKSLKLKVRSLNGRIDTLYQLVDVGVDVNQKSPSWAVVCLRGKQHHLKFYGANEGDIREILNFLRRFHRHNGIIDAPIAYYPFFKKEGYM